MLIRAADLQSLRGEGICVRFRDVEGCEKEGRFRQLGRSRRSGVVLVKYQDKYACVERTAYVTADMLVMVML